MPIIKIRTENVDSAFMAAHIPGSNIYVGFRYRVRAAYIASGDKSGRYILYF